MKHLKTFEGYLNEGAQVEETKLNEADVFVSNEKFKDEATLKADIIKNAGPALAKFLKDKGLDWPTPVTVEEKHGRFIQIASKPVTGAALGIMQYGFKEVYITFFNGGQMPKIQKATADDGSDFQFTPSIWCNLNYSYVHGSASTSSQGTNGCNLFLPGTDSNNIWYDIANGVWLDQKEAQKAGF